MKISKKRILFFTARSDTNGPMICVWTHDIRWDHLTPIRLFHVPEHISQSVLHKIWPGGENMYPYSMQNAVYETKTLFRKSRKSVLKFSLVNICVYTQTFASILNSNWEICTVTWKSLIGVKRSRLMSWVQTQIIGPFWCRFWQWRNDAKMDKWSAFGSTTSLFALYFVQLYNNKKYRHDFEASSGW